MKLHKLELRAFRGATQPFTLEFDPKKPITMLFGENGSGKSTISDALICLCTDAHGSLDDKSGVDKAYLVAATADPAQLQLQLQTDSGSFGAHYASKKIVRHPAAGRPRLRHLRRSSVVALSTAIPSERYNQLAEYFDLSGVVKSEDGLRNLVRNLKSESESTIRTLYEVQRILEEIWRNEGGPAGSWEHWAETETQKNLDTESKRLKNIRALLDSSQQALQASDKLRDIREQGAQAAQTRQTAEARLAALQQSAGLDPALLTLLQQARDLVSAHTDHNTCPVCEQTVRTPELLSALDQRLDSMAALRETAEAANAARAEHERLQTLWQAALDEFGAALARLAEHSALPECPPTLAETIAEALATDLAPRQRAEHFQHAAPRLAQLLDGQQIMAESISKTLDQHRLIAENWKSVLDYRTAAQQYEQRLKAAELALETVEKTRKRFIDNELTAISADVDALYQTLHPGEHLGDIRLFLKEKGKNSLELSARFHGHADLAPQSVYSESHLDTLALCIFFALAKRYDGADTILLLDDVLSACDEAHLDRFIDLLHREAPHFAHVVVTTHYRPWRERYRQQRAPNDVHFIDLKPWSLTQGIGYRKIQSDITDLKNALANINRREIAASAGVVLESVLDYLTMLYACRLRRNPKNVYTLGELLDAVLAKLAGSLSVEHYAKDSAGTPARVLGPVSLKPLLLEIKRLSDLRNIVGAHYNPAGAEAGDQEVQHFGEKTLELVSLLCCPQDGSLPNKAESGSYFETRKGTVRLHPLREPS